MPNALRICALLLLVSIGYAQDLTPARTFVQGLYNSYEHPSGPDGPNVLGKSASRIFSPSLLQLIRRDQARTPRGDAPALDGDPICDCQDAGGLHLVGLTVKPVDASHAIAQASLSFPGEKAARIIRLSLLDTPAGWRVDDIATSDTPSLRKFLQQGH